MESPKVGRDQRVLAVAVLAKLLVVGENSSMATPGSSEQLFAADQTNPKGRTTAPAGRARTFRPYDPIQQFLLPPSIDEWLPEAHPARFVAEAVDELLDVAPIHASYQSFDGAPPYHPTMMLKLLLWGYLGAVTSSREMTRRGATDVAPRYLCANQAPDHRSIARFRRHHLAALEDLFVEAVVDEEAGDVGQLCSMADRMVGTSRAQPAQAREPAGGHGCDGLTGSEAGPARARYLSLRTLLSRRPRVVGGLFDLRS